MNRVRFIYRVQHFLALDRHEMCPVPTKEVGQKGSAKLYRVPPAKGYHQQSGLKCTGLRPSPLRPGYRRMYGESTNLSWKPLYLRNTSLSSVMAREERGAIRVGFTISPGRYE